MAFMAAWTCAKLKGDESGIDRSSYMTRETDDRGDEHYKGPICRMKSSIDEGGSGDRWVGEGNTDWRRTAADWTACVKMGVLSSLSVVDNATTGVNRRLCSVRQGD
jgi:hypothetical protein